MLTEKEKKLLEDKIYSMLKESIFEDSIFEDGDNNQSEQPTGQNKDAKRKSVMKWLNSAQQLHSQLAYNLWGKTQSTENEKATARSLFSKKFRGEDADGKKYSFNDDEINTLYNMKDSFIDKIQ